MSWGQPSNQGGWGNQGGNQGGWGGQQQGGNQGGWGAQIQGQGTLGQQGGNQGGWGGQQQGGNQGGWGTQGTQQQQGGWGTQGTQQQQGGWGGQQGGNQGGWGGQKPPQQQQQGGWGQQQQGGNQWGGQQQGQGQQQGGQYGNPIAPNLNKKRNENGKFNKRQYYSIVSEKAGRVLDVAQDGPRKGSLIIWDGYNGDNQAFGIVQQGGSYLLKCRQNKGFLTVENANDGARIFLSAQPTAQSLFRLDETQSGSRKFIIYTFCGKVLDLYQGIKDNGTAVIQWTYNGNSNQVWYLNNPKDISSSSSELGV